MGVTTLRLPDEKLKILRAISGYENRPLSKIFDELVEEYIGRHKETIEILRISNIVKECKEGMEEIKSGKGKNFSDLED
jgi:predicted DNA-binding protein